MKPLTFSFFCCAVVLTCASPIEADLYEYDPIEGETVTFSQIEEMSNTSDAPVFGSPFGSGDTVSFVPFGFQSFASGDLDFVEGRLRFDLTANEGFVITAIELVESTSFLLLGDDAMVLSNSFGIANSGGELFESNTTNIFYGDNVTGQNSFQSGFVMELPDVNTLTFLLDAQILASASSSQLASLSKDGIVLRVTTERVSVIPEPSSSACLLLAFGCFAFKRKTRI